ASTARRFIPRQARGPALAGPLGCCRSNRCYSDSELPGPWDERPASPSVPRPPIVPSDGVTPIVLGVSDDSIAGVVAPPASPVDEPLRLVPMRARDDVLREVLLRVE